jgi:hypothetical protein
MKRKALVQRLLAFQRQLLTYPNPVAHAEYREWVWMLTPNKWAAYERAYDRWMKKQLGEMPVPKEFV